jgi:RNA polymerase sigma factor (sigma-70 family)
MSINKVSNQEEKLMDNLIFKGSINSIDDCEKLLFGIITTAEYEELEDQDIDGILFKDFKEKFEDEDLDIDEFLEEIEDENDLKTIEKSIEKTIKEFNKKSSISLEQAVINFKNGVIESFDQIYDHYKPILARYGKRYNNEELAIELLDIVLLNAAKTFDENAKTKFNTYYWTCVHNHVNCYRIKNNAQKRAHNKDMKSLQDKFMHKGDATERDLESRIEDANSNDDQKNKELKMSIMALEDCLKSQEITILLKLIDNYTLQEIGNSLGVTAAAVCMSLKRISNKTKAAKKLKEILKYQ